MLCRQISSFYFYVTSFKVAYSLSCICFLCIVQEQIYIRFIILASNKIVIKPFDLQQVRVIQVIVLDMIDKKIKLNYIIWFVLMHFLFRHGLKERLCWIHIK